MSVYIDEIRKWPTKIRCFQNGSCHLWADTVDELHEFAKNIGLKPEWFQNEGLTPHYDLTPTRRNIALLLGAIEKRHPRI